MLLLRSLWSWTDAHGGFGSYVIDTCAKSQAQEDGRDQCLNYRERMDKRNELTSCMTVDVN